MISRTVVISIYTSIQDKRAAMNDNKELQMLKAYRIKGWLHTKDDTEPGVEEQHNKVQVSDD